MYVRHFRMPIRILLLLLGLSYLVAVSAISATRTHNLNTRDNSALPFSTHQLETLNPENGEMEEQVDMDKGFVEIRRMLQDYGAGAEVNADYHNPKIPP